MGREFGDSKSTLSELGSSIINKFVTDNKNKIEQMQQQENDIDKYRKSKPEPFINPWKNSKHPIGEFNIIPCDKVHSFTKEKKPKYLIEEPFKIPSKYGKYLEHDIKII